MNELKQYEVLNRASLFLEKYNREPRVAELLLQHHLGVSGTTYFMNMREEVSAEVVEAFMADIKQHSETGIPIQHLIGSEEFYGRTFSVDKSVLIPRPETEELVELVLKESRNRQNNNNRLVDVGTGSGVIGITLALELSDAKVLATDISTDALTVAKKNAKDLSAPVSFYQGNFLQPLIDEGKTVDVIVSNPPYIAKEERESLSDTVKNFDPSLALFAEDDGLAAYKVIVEQSIKVLNPDGIIAFEMGHNQGLAIKEVLLKTYPQANVDIIQDINKKDRIVLAKL